jgi:hypothetical protein
MVVDVVSEYQTDLGIAGAVILVGETCYQTKSYREGVYEESTPIRRTDTRLGQVKIAWEKNGVQEAKNSEARPHTMFIKTVATMLGQYASLQQMLQVTNHGRTETKAVKEHRSAEWRVDLNLLRQTDRPLFMRTSQKLLTHLCLAGIKEAEKLRECIISRRLSNYRKQPAELYSRDPALDIGLSPELSAQVFELAGQHLPNEEILKLLRRWIHEDKLCSLVQVLDANRSFSQVSDALRKYFGAAPGQPDSQAAIYRGVVVSLIRRFLSDQLEYINIAKRYLHLPDFQRIGDRVISSPWSHGKIGGKAACLLLAGAILRRSPAPAKDLPEVKVPRTWYIASDMMLRLTHYNGLYEIAEHKYKTLDQIRDEYPYIVKTFQNAQFPPELENGLSAVLDSFGEMPLVVRSSSLLEDRLGITFSGKYDSYFLTNQGTRQERLNALIDAVAKVYASTFAPEPISYRAELGLLDFSEEMGVMIQEAVGERIGDFFFPLISGVAFSRSDEGQGGIFARIIPGFKLTPLDTAPDCLVKIDPGHRSFDQAAFTECLLRQIPDTIDVLNLKSRKVESQCCVDFLSRKSAELFDLDLHTTDSIRLHSDRSIPAGSKRAKDEDLRVLADLIAGGPFPRLLGVIVDDLSRVMSSNVRIQFSSNGKDLSLLQCKTVS